MKVLEEDKIKEFLAGYPGYGINNPWADTPTHPDEVFDEFAKRIGNDPELRQRFFKALLELSEDEDYGWMSMYYLRNLKHLEATHQYRLLTGEYVAEVAKRIRAHKSKWNGDQRWLGAGSAWGLWGDVQGMNEIIYKQFKLKVLPEEL